MKSLSEYKKELIAKGYNQQKRKQLYELFSEKQKHKKKSKRHDNPYRLELHDWISKYPIAKMQKYVASGKLRLFYPWAYWNTWHYCVKFVTVPPILSNFFVQDGNVWTNSTTLAKYLNISYEQLLIDIVETKKGIIFPIKYQIPTFSYTLNQSQMMEVKWFSLDDLIMFNTLHVFHDHDLKWCAFYDNALETQEWIDTHPWVQTVNHSTISGKGNLKQAIHTIAKLESELTPPIHFNIDHNSVWANTIPHYIEPWADTYTYFKHRKYLFFEGSC